MHTLGRNPSARVNNSDVKVFFDKSVDDVAPDKTSAPSYKYFGIVLDHINDLFAKLLFFHPKLLSQINLLTLS
jgi:hypothetical protein